MDFYKVPIGFGMALAHIPAVPIFRMNMRFRERAKTPLSLHFDNTKQK